MRAAIAISWSLILAAVGCSAAHVEATPDGETVDAGETIDAGAVDAGDLRDGGDRPDAGEVLPRQTTFGGGRPVTIAVPTDYDERVPTPLLVLLHGRGASGSLQTTYFSLSALVNEAGILFAAPDGVTDSHGSRSWNATDACCDFDHSNRDDVGYVVELIRDISAVWNVDPKRVYLLGHSNGGFLSYRLACEHADKIAAIVSLAGATFATASSCAPSEGVSVLQIHGDRDSLIPYDGGVLEGVAFPGAVTTVGLWAGYDGCTGHLEPSGTNVDLASLVSGAETERQTHGGCPVGIDASLWTIRGGSHIPVLTSEFRTLVWDWLAAHPKR